MGACESVRACMRKVLPRALSANREYRKKACVCMCVCVTIRPFHLFLFEKNVVLLHCAEVSMCA